jgi:3-hydroxybutyryl-CoA dehydratase
MSDGVFREDPQLGREAGCGRTADGAPFAAVAGDTSPVRPNEDCAPRGGILPERIAHGMLATGRIAKVLGTRLPGPIHLPRNPELGRPVRIDGTATATVEAAAPHPERRHRATLRMACAVQGEAVPEGEAHVPVPSRRSRYDHD